MPGALVTENKCGVRVGMVFIENRGTNRPLGLGREIPHPLHLAVAEIIVHGSRHPAILAPGDVWQSISACSICPANV
jgi:hypothetical protein